MVQYGVMYGTLKDTAQDGVVYVLFSNIPKEKSGRENSNCLIRLAKSSSGFCAPVLIAHFGCNMTFFCKEIRFSCICIDDTKKPQS